MIKVINYHYKSQPGDLVVNTTSRSRDWSQSLSPFFCGPCELYDGYVSQNMENAWQYSKVYEYYLKDNGTVGKRYFDWAQSGWNKIRADRYPMGKEAKPLYSYWDGEKFSYVEARKKIYIPLYARVVQRTFAFEKLKELVKTNEKIFLLDFDAHNLEPGTFDYWELVNNPNLKVGHAYVLAMLLEGIIHE